MRISLPDNRVVNSAFLLSGAACALILLSPSCLGMRGSDLLARICGPLMGLWFGLFMREETGKPGWIIQALVAVVAVAILAALVFDPVTRFHTHTFRMAFYACLGYIVPVGMFFSRDSWVKKAMSLTLSVTLLAVLEFIRGRLLVLGVSEESDDLRRLMFKVLDTGLALASLLSVWMAAEFTLSRTGQWLGSRTWFRVVFAVPMMWVFVALSVNLFWRGVSWWEMADLAVQPVTILAVVALARWIGKKCKNVLPDSSKAD